MVLKFILFVAFACLVTGKPHSDHGNHGHHYGWHKHDPQHNTNQKIVGGTETWPHVYPFMAALLGEGNIHYCGATLINQWQVLTAAHCIDRSELGSSRVALGLHNINNIDNGVSQIMDIANVIQHDNYNPRSLDNDIALITFTSPVTFSSHVRPIYLARSAYSEGTMVTAIGWGRLTAGGNAPENLQHVHMPLVGREACDEAYSYVNGQGSITNSMICAGVPEGGKDSCQGDSGGPLIKMFSWELVGVTSWGNGCGWPGYPGVYSDVYHSLLWIDDHWFDY